MGLVTHYVDNDVDMERLLEVRLMRISFSNGKVIEPIKYINYSLFPFKVYLQFDETDDSVKEREFGFDMNATGRFSDKNEYRASLNKYKVTAFRFGGLKIICTNL